MATKTGDMQHQDAYGIIQGSTCVTLLLSANHSLRELRNIETHRFECVWFLSTEQTCEELTSNDGCAFCRSRMPSYGTIGTPTRGSFRELSVNGSLHGSYREARAPSNTGTMSYGGGYTSPTVGPVTFPGILSVHGVSKFEDNDRNMVATTSFRGKQLDSLFTCR